MITTLRKFPEKSHILFHHTHQVIMYAQLNFFLKKMQQFFFQNETIYQQLSYGGKKKCKYSPLLFYIYYLQPIIYIQFNLV